MRWQGSRHGRRSRGARLALGWMLLLSILALASPPLAAPARAQLTVDVGMLDALAFDPALISVQPGENVTLRLANEGALDHTFTLFAAPNPAVPVNDNAALQQYNQTQEKLVDVFLAGGQAAEVTFQAPSAEAEYVYVCMVPGHAVGGMHGVLRVGQPGGEFRIGIGVVQALLLIAVVGTVVFAFAYHVRTTRGR